MCRFGRGFESPELASPWLDYGCYHSSPAQNVWAFGLLLLRSMGGHKPPQHLEALRDGTNLEYLVSLAHAVSA